VYQQVRINPSNLRAILTFSLSAAQSICPNKLIKFWYKLAKKGEARIKVIDEEDQRQLGPQPRRL